MKEHLFPEAARLAEFLREAGVAPGDVVGARQFLERLGVGEQVLESKEEVVELLRKLGAGWSPERRRAFAGLVAELAAELGCGPVPEDVASFLEEWQE